MNANQKLDIFTLANGLRFIHAKSHETASFELSIHIDSGSRDETPHTNGVSHFLEHMMFRGSEHLPNSVALAAAMESFGGEANAMTSIENTVYWLKGSARRLEDAFGIFSEFFLRPNFADLETERDIVLQELASDYNEAGDNIDSETLAMGSMFPGHPLGLPIIGTEESIQRLTLAELQQKHGEYYTPKNCILTLVSPYPTDKVKLYAEKTFGTPWTHAQQTTPTRSTLPENYFNQAKPKRTLVLQNNSDNQYVFKLMLPSSGGLNERVVHDIILERLLDDGISSRLPATIREKHGLVYDISADAQSYADVGTFSIDATISQNSMQRLLDTLLTELVRICREPPTTEELDRLKFRYLFDLEVMNENHSRLIAREVTQMFLNIKLPLSHEAEIVQAITPATVQHTAKQILTHSRQTVVLVGPRARKFRSSIEKFLDSLSRGGG